MLFGGLEVVDFLVIEGEGGEGGLEGEFRGYGGGDEVGVFEEVGGDGFGIFLVIEGEGAEDEERDEYK